jgi:hypothetical protein
MKSHIKLATLAGATFDFYDDPEFINNPKSEQLFKAKKLVRVEKLDALPDDAFAASIEGASTTKRAYPIYNKTAAFLSNIYFNKTKGNFPIEKQVEIYDTLKTASASFGIEPPAEVVIKEDVNIKALVKSAIDNFKQNVSSVSYKRKVAAANKIMSIAKTAGLSINDPDVLSYVPRKKYGSYLNENFAKRKNALLMSNSDIMYHVLNHLEKSASAIAPIAMMQAVEIIDNMMGLNKSYGESWDDPAVTVFGLMKTGTSSYPTDSDRFSFIGPTYLSKAQVVDDIDLNNKFKLGPVDFDDSENNIPDFNVPQEDLSDETFKRFLYQYADNISDGLSYTETVKRGGRETIKSMFMSSPLKFYANAPKSLKDEISRRVKDKIKDNMLKADDDE